MYLTALCLRVHTVCVTWEVLFHSDFDAEFDELSEAVQDELLAHTKLLEQFGPQLGRPRVDTLNNSRHANIKELPSAQQMVNGEWPSPLTQSVVPFCWWPGINRAEVKRSSIDN